MVEGVASGFDEDQSSGGDDGSCDWELCPNYQHEESGANSNSDSSEEDQATLGAPGSRPTIRLADINPISGTLELIT